MSRTVTARASPGHEHFAFASGSVRTGRPASLLGLFILPAHVPASMPESPGTSPGKES